MALKAAINGFGRIGRLIFRIGMKETDFDFAAVNDVCDPKNLAYLLKHDSVHGVLAEDVKVENDELVGIVTTTDMLRLLAQLISERGLGTKDSGRQA